jgi:hypothetical protein
MIGGRDTKQTVQQVLIAYSSLLTSILMILLLAGAKAPRNESFDNIQVHRIVLSSRTELCEWLSPTMSGCPE